MYEGTLPDTAMAAPAVGIMWALGLDALLAVILLAVLAITVVARVAHNSRSA